MFPSAYSFGGSQAGIRQTHCFLTSDESKGVDRTDRDDRMASEAAERYKEHTPHEDQLLRTASSDLRSFYWA